MYIFIWYWHGCITLYFMSDEKIIQIRHMCLTTRIFTKSPQMMCLINNTLTSLLISFKIVACNFLSQAFISFSFSHYISDSEIQNYQNLYVKLNTILILILILMYILMYIWWKCICKSIKMKWWYKYQRFYYFYVNNVLESVQ